MQVLDANDLVFFQHSYESNQQYVGRALPDMLQVDIKQTADNARPCISQ